MKKTRKPKKKALLGIALGLAAVLGGGAIWAWRSPFESPTRHSRFGDGARTRAEGPAVSTMVLPPCLSWTRRIAGVAAIVGASAAFLVVAFVVVVKAMHRICIAPEPGLEGTPEILSAEPRAEGDRTVVGRSWIAKRRGIRQMYLEGDPFTIGLTNARLTTDLMREQEDNLLRTMRTYVPSYVARWLLGHYILVRNRRLPRFVPDEFKLEILGLSRGHRNYHPEISPLYHRTLNYHAAHDIGHSVEDSPLATRRAVEDSSQAIRSAASSLSAVPGTAQAGGPSKDPPAGPKPLRRGEGPTCPGAGDDTVAGCTSFAAWGSHVPDGHVIVGRNCDLEAGPCFDVNKIVILIRPREGHAFISVSWAGWMGVATGMNDQRLFVSINAAHTVDRRKIGTPVCLVARQVLQYASTIDEAVGIIEKARVFVSDGFLIADGKEGRALVVEKSPERTAVHEAGADFMVSANHFLSETFRDDRANRDFMASATSVARSERMRELVARAAGKLDVPRAAAILRDRRGKNDLDVGNGNRSTINPLIATHSVIADVTAGALWVAAAPHQLGAYVPFSVSDFGAVPDEEVVPEDTFLTGGGYSDYLRSEELLARGEALYYDRSPLPRLPTRPASGPAGQAGSRRRRRAVVSEGLLRSGRTAEAERLLRESSELNPEFFRPYVLLAEIALGARKGRVPAIRRLWRGLSGTPVASRENIEEARRLLERALERQPPFRRHRETIEGLLRRSCSAT